MRKYLTLNALRESWQRYKESIHVTGEHAARVAVSPVEEPLKGPLTPAKVNNSLFSGYRWFSRWWWAEVLNPRTYWRWVKRYHQRGTRGYADEDLWSIDWYLSNMLVPALTQFKNTTHGHPSVLAQPDADPSDDANWVGSMAEWHAELDTMIAGFQAAIDLQDTPDRFFPLKPVAEYEAEKAAAEKRDADRTDNLSEWVSPMNMDVEGYNAWEAERTATMNKGMLKFVERYRHLWD